MPYNYSIVEKIAAPKIEKEEAPKIEAPKKEEKKNSEKIHLINPKIKGENLIKENENTEEINTANVTYSAIETEILNLVNEHRSDIGINKLNSLDIISNVADTHTQYMIQLNEVNHDNFPMRAQVLMEQTDANSVGEIVAYGFNTTNGVVNGWLNSPAHRTIIENPNYTHFGISIKPNSLERNFFTHIFIRTK